MGEVLVPFIVFGAISLWVYLGQAHRRRMKELEIEREHAIRALPAAPAASAAVPVEVEQRLRHLESIVCSVDFELNAKLDRLASQQLALTAAPAQSAGPGSVAVDAPTHALARGELVAGQSLAGRFEIVRVIGQGGMGAVYLARDRQLGEEVALKVIAGLMLLDPQASDRMRREASAARRISHTNVVRLHDLGEDQGVLFLSMEYVSGQSVRDLIARHGRLPLDRVRDILSQALAGIEAAHAQAVLHRDLKPANLLLDASGQVKIIDFGIARLPSLQGMTATGMLLGTPEYMAPEQIRGGGAADSRIDLYAMGACCFHMVTGRPPFLGDNPIAVSLAQMLEAPPSPKSLRPDLSPEWDAFILRALEKDPAKRFSTAAEMRAALPAAV